MATTKDFYLRLKHNFVFVLSTKVRANNATQAANRFLKKNSAMLLASSTLHVFDGNLNEIQRVDVDSGTTTIVPSYIPDESEMVTVMTNELRGWGIEARFHHCNDLKLNNLLVVLISGGKDSQACYELAVEEHPDKDIVAVFCDTQNEHDYTYDHVSKIAQGKPFVYLCGGSVTQVARKKGRLPSGKSRFCTSHLKIRAGKMLFRALARYYGGFEVWVGVRTDESTDRANRYATKVADELYTPYEYMPSCYTKELADTYGIMIRLPILHWTTLDVYETVGIANLNPLYRMGHDRVGCFPCWASGDKLKAKAFLFDGCGNKFYTIAMHSSLELKKKFFRSKGYFLMNPHPFVTGEVIDESGYQIADVDGAGCSFCAI